jgi:hypothetical protein
MKCTECNEPCDNINFEKCKNCNAPTLCQCKRPEAILNLYNRLNNNTKDN